MKHQIWRITPVADIDDPSWQGREIWASIKVAARTAGEAIALAAEATQMDRHLASDKQTVRSGLEDTRLYRVDLVAGAVADSPAVLEMIERTPRSTVRPQIG